MRTLILLLRNAWLGHVVLVSLCVTALQVHAAYRVPAGPLLLLLPWVGVAATTTSVLMLLVSLLPRGDGGTVARILDRVDRRSVWLVALLIPSSCAASFFTTSRWLSLAYLGLGVSVAVATVGALTRRVIVEGGATFAGALRWMEAVALTAVGAFLCWSAVVFVNGAFDISAPVVQDSEVVGVVTASVDPGFSTLLPQTQVDLRSWRSTGRVERLVLAPRERYRVWVGEPVRLRVHAGRLGLPWISTMELDELRHARQILAVSPTAMHAYKRLTRGLLNRGQLDEAVVVTRRFAQLYPDDTEEMVFVAGYLGVAGRYREQVEIIRPAAARRPTYGALCMLGTGLAKGGDPLAGIEVLNRATSLNPNSFLAFHYLGEIYHAIGRYDDAIRAYEAEMVLRPRSRETQQRIETIRKLMASRAGTK